MVRSGWELVVDVASGESDYEKQYERMVKQPKLAKWL